MPFLKNFLDWFKLKPKLDNRNHKPPFVKEGQIWWCHLGENIGTEISGKNEVFTRTVIIFKKLSHFTYLVVPTSTKLNYPDGRPKIGSWFVEITQKGVKNLAYLHQIRVIDYRRLENIKGFLDDTDFAKIEEGLLNLYFKPKK